MPRGPCWPGVGGDWQSAFAYFNVAADGGHVDAKFDLAMCYLKVGRRMLNR